MEELIIKMAVCLLAALALGFLLGWFIKRAFAREYYEPRIEELELNCAQDKSLIQEQEQESALIKEQFMSAKNDLDTSALQLTQAKEHIVSYKTEITTLKNHLSEKELQVQDAKQLLDTKEKEIANKIAELGRVKEHHALLKGQVDTLTQEQHSKDEDINKLSLMADNYKSDYTKLLEEQSSHHEQLTSLKNTLNERNLATVDLEKRIREVTAKNHQMSLSTNATQSTKAHYKEEPSTAIMISPSEHSPYDRWKKFVKKTLSILGETRESIDRKGDKVIQDYKNKNR